MEKEKCKRLSSELTYSEDYFMDNLRKNLGMYVSEPDITLRAISEKADIPLETLKKLLYKDSRDCKLSTVIGLAKTFGVTVDELIGGGSLTESDMRCISMFRNLPEHYQYIVKWFLKRQSQLTHEKFRQGRKTIPVMILDENVDGTLHISSNFNTLDISTLPDNIRPQIFMGIRLGVDHYMPTYSPYDILLIANDRNPKPSENSVIICANNVFVARRCPVGNHGYASIRDGKFRCYEKDVDDVIGYVAYVYRTDTFE